MAGILQLTTRSPRQDNRREHLLDAAAHLFSNEGFHAASMRDIAKAAGMLSGSIYYHFDSKEELLLAIYQEGARRLAEAVENAVAQHTDPWQRLEAACAAHLSGLIAHRDYARVMIQTSPDQAGGVGQRIRELRRDYEGHFRELIEALPLPKSVDRRYMRMLLFGALNWSPIWFRADRDSPQTVASRFVALLQHPLGSG